MAAYDDLQKSLRMSAHTWLITGVAGFIGSNLLEQLLMLEQSVVGLDNFATGHKRNLEEVRKLVGEKRWLRFRLIEGDVREPAVCQQSCSGVEFVLHQAALGSVPRSISEPLQSHSSNVTGTLNLLLAARDATVRRFVFASSSAVYGDAPELPKIEERTGSPLSPYAATKAINELYASVIARVYVLPSIGLRYFNVFGPRQDPEGAYAAVIPKWTAALLSREPVHINGDGETSRDFCYIDNVVQANLLAATTQNTEALNQVFNVGLGERTTLNELFNLIQEALKQLEPGLPQQKPAYRDFRAGDVRHSLADISKAKRLLGYEPSCRIKEGLEKAMDWYRRSLPPRQAI